MDVVQLKSGEFALLNKNKTLLIPFNEMNDEMISTFGLHENIVGRFQNYGKGRDNDLFELVKREGFENEYCLVFMNKICFHSTSLEEVEQYENEHAIAFTRYGPL